MMGNVVARLGDRTLFAGLQARAYLSHAGISPLSDPVVAAAGGVMADMAARGALAFGTWGEQRDALRGRLAELVGGSAADFALMPNTMHGLATVALSFPWRAGDRVVVFEGEYPTNVSVWQRAAERFDLTSEFVPVSDMARPSGPDFSRLQDALSRGPRLCAVSAVQFQSG